VEESGRVKRKEAKGKVRQLISGKFTFAGGDDLQLSRRGKKNLRVGEGKYIDTKKEKSAEGRTPLMPLSRSISSPKRVFPFKSAERGKERGSHSLGGRGN